MRLKAGDKIQVKPNSKEHAHRGKTGVVLYSLKGDPIVYCVQFSGVDDKADFLSDELLVLEKVPRARNKRK